MALQSFIDNLVAREKELSAELIHIKSLLSIYGINNVAQGVVVANAPVKAAEKQTSDSRNRVGWEKVIFDFLKSRSQAPTTDVIAFVKEKYPDVDASVVARRTLFKLKERKLITSTPLGASKTAGAIYAPIEGAEMK